MSKAEYPFTEPDCPLCNPRCPLCGRKHAEPCPSWPEYPYPYRPALPTWPVPTWPMSPESWWNPQVFFKTTTTDNTKPE